MALIYDNKVFRNLQEQVEKNKADIVDLQQTEMALNAYGIKVVGQVEEESDIPDDFSGDYGDAYLVGTEAPYDVYVWTRPNSETPTDHFVDIGPIAIIGPRGPQGPKGDTGNTGAQGIGWASYTDNPASLPEGTFGLNGTNGNVYKVVSNEWVQVGNIKGATGAQGQQGATGATGPQGPQGPQGPKGDTGSSYQIIGTYASTSVLPDPTLVNPGSAALVGADAPYELYIVVGATQDSQLWQDAGVFNDQAESIPCIEVTLTNSQRTSIQGTSTVNITISADQAQVLNSAAFKDAIIVLKTSYNEMAIFRKQLDQPTPNQTLSYSRFVYIGYGIFGYTGSTQNKKIFRYINWYPESSTTINVYYVDFEFEPSSNKKTYIDSTSNLYYPTTKAVFDYVQPYVNQIPVLSATMDITGLVNGDYAELKIYATQDSRNQWVDLMNIQLSTNYTFTQMLTFLQTTLNAYGAAPATNKAAIWQILYFFAGMQLFNGSARWVTSDTNDIITAMAKLQLGILQPAAGSMSIYSVSASAPIADLLSFDVFLGLEWDDDNGHVLTDSDTLTFTITKNIA